jgi:hypothetical protein
MVIPADDAILDEPFAGFGHLLVFLLRLQEFTWIADRDRAREGVDMLDGAEHFFNGHAQHRLVDHSQNEDAFEDLADEGRIAIFKNEFLGRPMRAEGFANGPCKWPGESSRTIYG